MDLCLRLTPLFRGCVNIHRLLFTVKRELTETNEFSSLRTLRSESVRVGAHKFNLPSGCSATASATPVFKGYTRMSPGGNFEASHPRNLAEYSSKSIEFSCREMKPCRGRGACRFRLHTSLRGSSLRGQLFESAREEPSARLGKSEYDDSAENIIWRFERR